MAAASSEKIAQDLALAKRICEKLKAGMRDCLSELFREYNGLFKYFARRRLYKPENYEDVVQNFWEELMNARAICAYAQRTEKKATLKTYLLRSLRYRIIDENRRNFFSSPPEPVDPEAEDQGNPLDDVLRRSLVKLVHGALIKLSESSPIDADLVRMHLEGLNYKEMAERVGKKPDSIKKQFTRQSTGSLAKFKMVVKNLMLVKNLRYEDII